MEDRNRNLLVRIMSVAVLLPLILLILYRGGIWAALLIAVAAGLCTGEYYLITFKRLDLGSIPGIVAAAVLPLCPVVVPGAMGEAAFGTLAFAFMASWIRALLSTPLTDAPARAAHLFTGVAYSGVGLYALSALLRARGDGLQWVVAALTVTWANDTLAYFAGRFLGRHKLYPEVSPNKTWEGFVGGLFGSVGGLFVARAVYVSSLTAVDCVILGILGGILGPLGDLCESLLKRAHGVKDSSRLIPGHGGLLDRVDALLFNAPLVYVYVRFLRHVWTG